MEIHITERREQARQLWKEMAEWGLVEERDNKRDNVRCAQLELGMLWGMTYKQREEHICKRCVIKGGCIY